jgi:hypothetical protein
MDPFHCSKDDAPCDEARGYGTESYSPILVTRGAPLLQCHKPTHSDLHQNHELAMENMGGSIGL